MRSISIEATKGKLQFFLALPKSKVKNAVFAFSCHENIPCTKNKLTVKTIKKKMLNLSCSEDGLMQWGHSQKGF
jgi:hypothetical protein